MLHATLKNPFCINFRGFGVTQTVLKAESADYEGDLKKLEKEAEERLDVKIKELMSNIEKAGASEK